VGTLIEDIVVQEMLQAVEERLENRINNLESTCRELDRQLTDERCDRERMGDNIRSEMSGLEHKINFG
jgi:chaperonin cofactor prefoldin